MGYNNDGYGNTNYMRAVRPYNNNQSLLSFNTYTPEYIGRPIETYAKMMETMSKNNKDIVDMTNAIDLAISNSNISDSDNSIKLQQKQMLNNGIDEIIKAKDYNLIEAKLNKLVKESQTNPLFNKALENKAIYDAWQKEEKDRYLKGQISEARYNKNMQLQAKPTVLNPTTGLPETNSYENGANYVDLDPKIANIISKFPVDSYEGIPIAYPDENNPYQINYFTQNTTEYRKSKELREAIEQGLLSDTEAKDFIYDQAEALGINPMDLIKNVTKAHMLYGAQPKITQKVINGNMDDIKAAEYKQILENQSKGVPIPVTMGAVRTGDYDDVPSKINNAINGKITAKSVVSSVISGITTPIPEGISESTKKVFNDYLKNVAKVDFTYDDIINKSPKAKNVPSIIEDFSNYYNNETLFGANLANYNLIPFDKKKDKDVVYNLFKIDSEATADGSIDKQELNPLLDNMVLFDLEKNEFVKEDEENMSATFNNLLDNDDRFNKSNKLRINALGVMREDNPYMYITKSIDPVKSYGLANATMISVNGHRFLVGEKNQSPESILRSELSTATGMYGMEYDITKTLTDLGKISGKDKVAVIAPFRINKNGQRELDYSIDDNNNAIIDFEVVSDNPTVKAKVESYLNGNL